MEQQDASKPCAAAQADPAAMTGTAQRPLRDVTLGFMSHFHIAAAEFDDWLRTRSGQAASQDTVETRMFSSVEDFFFRKMLFVGEARSADGGSTPARFKLAEPLTLTVKLVDAAAGARFDLRFNVLLAYYRLDEALIVFLYDTLTDVTVDQLIFLRDFKWYRQPQSGQWSLSWKETPYGSLRSATRAALQSRGLGCADTEGETDSPTFSLLQFNNIGPAREISTFPDHPSRLKLDEHWGLFSGDEGYRQVDVARTSRYTAALFDEAQQFTGRRHFFYHFAPTSCMAFFSADLVDRKTGWAEWYRTQVADVGELDAFLRLDARVPCLADGIPIAIELCLIRYIELQQVERALRRALDRRIKRIARLGRWASELFTPSLGSSIDAGMARLEQLDLHQDSSLWIIGGSYTDCLFSYAVLRKRVDRLAATLTAQMNARSTATVALVALAVSIAALVVSCEPSADKRTAAPPPPQARGSSNSLPPLPPPKGTTAASKGAASPTRNLPALR